MNVIAKPTDGLFRPKVAKPVRPFFRPRPSDSGDFVVMGQAPDGFEVFIHKRAAARLVYFLRQTAPNEAMGLLAGRPGIDSRGEYTVITGAIRARDDEVDATPGQVHVNTVNQQALRRQLEKKEPIAEPVGWWHTHPHGPAAYSGEDVREQSTWPESHHVGVLVSGRPERPTLTVYRGPTASLLGDQSLADNNQAIRYHVQRTRRKLRMKPKGYPRLDSRLVATVMLGWLLSLLIIVLAFTFVNQHIYAANVPIMNPVADPAIAISCSPRDGPAPLPVSCEVLTISSFVDLQWQVEDGVLLGGLSASHIYQSPGEYDISLIGTGPEGESRTYRTLRIHVGEPGAKADDENQASPD